MYTINTIARYFSVIFLILIYIFFSFAYSAGCDFNLQGINDALSCMKNGHYEQSRSILIPYIKYCTDNTLNNTAKILFAISYYFENDFEMSLCMLDQTIEGRISDEIMQDIILLLGEMAENLHNYSEEALKISLFILKTAPESNNAYYRVGYIYYMHFDDIENAMYYFTEGIRLYPKNNYLAYKFLNQ